MGDVLVENIEVTNGSQGVVELELVRDAAEAPKIAPNRDLQEKSYFKFITKDEFERLKEICDKPLKGRSKSESAELRLISAKFLPKEKNPKESDNEFITRVSKLGEAEQLLMQDLKSHSLTSFLNYQDANFKYSFDTKSHYRNYPYIIDLISNDPVTRQIARTARSETYNNLLEAAKSCHKAMEGAGTDEDKLLSTLRAARYGDGNTEILERIYEEKYKTSLREAVDSELTGIDQRLATFYMTGKFKPYYRSGGVKPDANPLPGEKTIGKVRQWWADREGREAELPKARSPFGHIPWAEVSYIYDRRETSKIKSLIERYQN